MKRSAAIVAIALVAVSGGACSASTTAIPRCRADQRLGIVAQSVPGAAYVPCVERLPAGWQFNGLHVNNADTRFSIQSDRDPRPVHVELRKSCDVGGATPTEPRAIGVRSYQRTYTIEPRYAATTYDVFPGGCVTTQFNFKRGPHVTLIDEMQQAIGLYSRRELSSGLSKSYGIELDK